MAQEVDTHFNTLTGVAQDIISAERRKQELLSTLLAERKTLDSLLDDELQRPAEIALQESGLAMQVGISRTGTVVLVLFAVAVAAGLVVGTRTARSITGPIERLLDGVEAIAEGQHAKRVGPDEEADRDELAKLAERFDHMADQLGGSTVPRRYLDDILGLIGEFLVVVDAVGRIVRANPAAIALLGYAEVELPGRPFGMLLVSPVPVGRLLEREAQLRTRDGRIVDVLLSASPLADEGHAALVYTATDVTAKKAAEAALVEAKNEIARLARYDELTGLPNRRFFEATLHSAVELAKRRNTALAVILLDVDDFKAVNDGYGDHIGDELLKSVAQRLYGCIRATDEPARYGSDEFAVLLESLAEGHDAALVADKILDALQRPALVRDHEIQISCSIGIAICPADGTSAADLLRAADMAMCKAKAAGKNRWMAYSAA